MPVRDHWEKLTGVIEDGRRPYLPRSSVIHFGASACPAGYRDYEELLARASDREPSLPVNATDPWMLMYTSGTTGYPKGVIRSHKGNALISLITEIELGIRREDSALLVMPMCTRSRSIFCAFNIAAANHDLLEQELRSGSLPEDAGGNRVDLHLARPTTTHDAGLPARRARGRLTRSPSDDLFCDRPSGYERAVRNVPQLRPVRALRVHGGRMGDDAAPA